MMSSKGANTYRLDAEAANEAIQAWVTKGRRYLWTDTPENVQARIWLERAADGSISEVRAREILDEAYYSRLIGGANGGMAWIKEQWRAMRFRPGATTPSAPLPAAPP